MHYFCSSSRNHTTSNDLSMHLFDIKVTIASCNILFESSILHILNFLLGLAVPKDGRWGPGTRIFKQFLLCSRHWMLVNLYMSLQLNFVIRTKIQDYYDVFIRSDYTRFDKLAVIKRLVS